MRQVFDRAGVRTCDVTLHTLRHTALSRMIAGGFDDYTVMSISRHSSTRMLERSTHPTETRKVAALDLPVGVVTKWAQSQAKPAGEDSPDTEIADLLKELVDGARIELATSALRTQRSPS